MYIISIIGVLIAAAVIGTVFMKGFDKYLFTNEN